MSLISCSISPLEARTLNTPDLSRILMRFGEPFPSPRSQADIVALKDLRSEDL